MTLKTYYFDISGQISDKSKFITTAGIAISKDKEVAIRNELENNNYPKWRNASYYDIEDIINLIIEYKLPCAIFKSKIISKEIKKNWKYFWKEGICFYKNAKAKDNVKLDDIKPANVLKFYLIGNCAALLIVHSMKNIKTNIFDSRGLRIVNFKIVSDTDIQGENSKEFFKSIWESWSKNSKAGKILGFSPILNHVNFETEQDEPLLILSDYMAGLFNWDISLVEYLPFKQDKIEYFKSKIMEGLDSAFIIKKESFNERFPLELDLKSGALISRW